jgi:DNA-binding winged helix-turn-helix (wHTH) protein
MDEVAAFTFGSFRFISAGRTLFEDGKRSRLGSRAFDILVALTERADRTFSKEELIARAWPGTLVEVGALRVHVAALRKALGDGRVGKRCIANLSGLDCAFISPVTRQNALSATSPRLPDGSRPGNLPALLTRVVGRDGIISRLAQQLVRRRFLTLTNGTLSAFSGHPPAAPDTRRDKPSAWDLVRPQMGREASPAGHAASLGTLRERRSL